MNVHEALTWNQLAKIYDANNNGRLARTLPMSEVFAWAENQKDKFRVTKGGSLVKLAP